MKCGQTGLALRRKGAEATKIYQKTRKAGGGHFSMFGFEELSKITFLRVAMIGAGGCFSGGKRSLRRRD
jgi:hypothetical protein